MKRAIKSSVNSDTRAISALKTRIRLLKTIFNAMEELDDTCFEQLNLSEVLENIDLAIRENTADLEKM